MGWTRLNCVGRLIGGARRDRTADLLRARQALSQLSYGPINTDEYSTRVTSMTSDHIAKDSTPVTWWVWVDLNHRPHPYQGCALTN